LRRVVESPQDRYLAKKGIGAGEGGWSGPFVPFASKRVCHAEIRRVRHDGVICHSAQTSVNSPKKVPMDADGVVGAQQPLPMPCC
jgi:hypothetical protein